LEINFVLRIDSAGIISDVAASFLASWYPYFDSFCPWINYQKPGKIVASAVLNEAGPPLPLIGSFSEQ
jgi:hypothetical protein